MSYFIVNDIKGNKTQMNQEMFSGMLFKFCFDFHNTRSWHNSKNNNPIEESDPAEIEALLHYKNKTFRSKFYFTIEVFDKNKFRVNILKGRYLSEGVAYCVQFSHMAPVNIENYADKAFIKKTMKPKFTI